MTSSLLVDPWAVLFDAWAEFFQTSKERFDRLIIQVTLFKFSKDYLFWQVLLTNHVHCHIMKPVFYAPIAQPGRAVAF